MTKAPKKGSNKGKKLILLIVIILAAYFGYHITNTLRYRMNKPISIEEVGDRALHNLQEDAGEVGFEKAQQKAQERGNEKLNSLQGQDKVVAASIGFLSIEYKLAQGYETYCKQHDVAQMPNMKKQTYALNKNVHDKALAILAKSNISETDVENNMLMPLEPQLLQAIDMELSSIVKDSNQSISDVCKELEKTAAQNKTLEIKLQNPNIVEIIEAN